jgi:adenylate kinase
MDEGKLVPDEVVIQMIANKIDSNPEAKGFIFDGFPRTLAQAVALDTLLNARQTPISCMISLSVPEEELVERLVKRGESSGRSDDNEATARKRFVEYMEKTMPVAAFYETQNKYFEVVGVGSIQEIFERITATLGLVQGI